ncbi:MAG: endopeptidase La [Candidatus Margulisbacteria bacterium]|jgi:ATP-dependent Lon protease|nr:endopeptidase La [Candidatus Margulisiibacteriota bacterium]
MKPLIPVRNIVVFPGMIIPLFVGRASSLAALEAAYAGDKLVLLAAQKDQDKEDPGAEDLYACGSLAKIAQLLRLPGGTIKVLVEGQKRVFLSAVDQADYLRAECTEISDLINIDEKLEDILRRTVAKFEEFVKANKKVPVETLMSIVNVDDPGRLSDLVASYLTLSLEEKQKLLELPSVYERLSLLNTYCTREIGLLKVEKGLDTNVQTQIEKIQKEYLLKEKLKAIQKELGEGGGFSETEDYRQKITAAGLPPEVESRARRELLRLEKMQSFSAESGVIRTYLDWLLDLPWRESAPSVFDLKQVAAALEQEHYGLSRVKDRVLEYFAVQQNTGRPNASIILLAGPPGVGKTSVAQAIAKALGRQFHRITLGGLRDEAELRGHRRTYVGAMPGKIIQAFARVKTGDPLILLDEIDKMARDSQGDPAAVLLEALDPGQNKAFLDNYLELPFDISRTIFIATANNVYDVPKALLDRLEIIRLSGYTEEEKLQIAKRYVLPKLLSANGIKKSELAFTDTGLRAVIREYTREAGLRDLSRALDEVCRKYVRGKLEKKKLYKKVSRHNLRGYLGPLKYQDARLNTQDEIGLVHGLAWTEAGGEVLPVEVTALKGKGSLQVTGRLGEVMQESAKAALTYVRSRYAELGLKEDFYKESDIHIHLPDGAIPKDGPSAGVAIAAALASALSGLPARGSLAMTGEVTLRGRVIAVGGLKEKILAAARSGIDTIILPADNKKDLNDLPAKARKKLKFLAVKNMDDVLFYALKGYKKQAGQQNFLPELLETGDSAERPERMI